jgi:two-component system, response regulator PdtaR
LEAVEDANLIGRVGNAGEGLRWPPIEIVATSGQIKLVAGDLPQGSRFLQKPHSHAEIMKTLRELIAA